MLLKQVALNSLLNMMLLLSAISCFAQGGKPPSKSIVEKPPPPAHESGQQAWKEFSSAEGRFSILFPGTPKSLTTTENSKLGPVDMRMFYLETSAANYMVAFADIPVNPTSPDEVKILLDGGRNRLLANKQRRLISESEITIGDHLGRELIVEDVDGITKARYYLVKQRLYQVFIVMPDDRNASPEIIKMHEATKSRFLDSFKLLTPPGAVH